MGGNLVQHLLKRSTSALNEVAIEATDGLLLRGRRNDITGVVPMQRVVQPQEVAVSALDLEFGLLESLGGSLYQGTVRINGVALRD
jgi:hypothetical protein